MSQAVPIANVWKGINRRLSPALISEQESPDSVNTDFKSGKVGILSGRKGAAKISDTAFAAPVLGIMPANFPGVSTPNRMLVVLNNGTIVDESALFSGGSAWTGPTTNTGFYTKQALSGTHIASTLALDVAVNGATRVMCTMASIKWATTGSLLIYGTFNNGVGRKLLSEMFAEYVDTCCCCGGGTLTITNTPTWPLPDISGATKLTLIDVVSDFADGDETISGDVIMMGVPV